MKKKLAVTGTKISLAEIDFMETDNEGRIVVTLKNGTDYIVPVTMALVFQNNQIVVG